MDKNNNRFVTKPEDVKVKVSIDKNKIEELKKQLKSIRAST